ncbi:hypothetical protein L1987_87510 [Smallanthus sonchifolius]|nr:hypothetical protein L1987_87510 [Smallanthus sonchifolius]
MAGRRPWLPMVVCCSTSDELDAVCSAVSIIPYICVTPCDLAEAERALILDKFRHVTMKWNQNAAKGCDKEEQKSHMIVATDACPSLLALGESHISSSVLINYELPTKKGADRVESRNNASLRKESSNVSQSHIAAHTFTFRELAAATNNFSHGCFLGEGGFGHVYRGRL